MTAARFAAVAVVILAATASPSDADCTKDTECKGDRVCDAGVCRAAPALAPAVTSCHNDKDCAGDLVCDHSVCAADASAGSVAPTVPGVTVTSAVLVAAPPAGAQLGTTQTAMPPAGGAIDQRKWLVDMNLYIVLYPYFSGGGGLLINTPVRIEHMLNENVSYYVTPDWAFTNYSDGAGGSVTLMSIGVNGGARYYVDKLKPMEGLWVGGNVGFATQIIGEGSFGMNILGEAGYTVGSQGAWTLSLGGTAGLNIPLYIANANSSGPSGLSPVSTSFVYALIISPGYRF
ncbi:MAG: hypothetical protein JWO36_3380 [Myxococcales bacterium]|nr:hypothetical protein [Myxococcales bacterium]